MRTLLACLVLSIAALGSGSGCQSTQLAPAGAYAGNSTLYATDASITAAFQVLDVFMVFQFQNAPSLPTDVNMFANKLRLQAPGWSKSILALRDVYAAAPTPANKANLDLVLKLVREAVVQASAYLVEKPISP